MRILHCCLAAFYIDNYSYQENILPRMHKLQGHNVAILASTETYIGTELGYLPPTSYVSKDGIRVTRVPYVSYFPVAISKKLRIYKGVTQVIEKFAPDILFLHDCQFLSITDIVRYVKRFPKVKIYVDGHTDFINSGRNWISKNILHQIIYKWCAQKIEPYTNKFYGVLPVRVDFFINVYGIAPEKVELLPLGADLTLVELNEKTEIRKTIRAKLNIKDTDFAIVTGGKLDNRKNIHVLMRAVNELQVNDLKLIVFGTPTKEMKAEIEELANSASIRNVGWVASEKTYDYLLSADLAIFPGTHSVLWEQAVGLGIPCIFKRWQGIQHVDLKGNCLFLETNEPSEIKEQILSVYQDRALLASMKRNAEERGAKAFSYYEIAKRAIE